MPKDTKELVVVEVSELACCLMLPKVLGAQLFFCVVPLVNLCNYMKLCVVGCVWWHCLHTAGVGSVLQSVLVTCD